MVGVVDKWVRLARAQCSEIFKSNSLSFEVCIITPHVSLPSWHYLCCWEFCRIWQIFVCGWFGENTTKLL